MKTFILSHPHTARWLRHTFGFVMYSALGVLSLALPSISDAAAPTSTPPRERLSLNIGWRFSKDDPADAVGKLAYTNISDWVIPTGAALAKDERLSAKMRPEGNLGSDVAYTQPGFDDSQWRLLNLPHDWGVEGPFQQQYDGATGRLPYWGVAWYRKHLDIPASDQGKQIYLDVDGAMSYAAVWLNGQFVGGWPFGYASWRVDLTPYVKPGVDNVLAIRLDNPALSSRWYPGGGIYRNVWLVKTSPVHVAQWGVQITTPQVNQNEATISVRVNLENSSAAEAHVNATTALIELLPDGSKAKVAVAVLAASGEKIAAGKTGASTANFTIGKPRLWSVAHPNRYVAVTTVEHDGRIVDRVETPFGIRTLKFDPDQGFFLNGERLKFNGVCDHHDLGALGAAINTRALQRQLEILRDMGCNAIRTSHNPPAPELLDLCDQMGFVVMDETFDTWQRAKRPNDYARLFADWHEQDTRMLVRRDRNHPSVIMWSIGNEIAEQGMGTNGAAVAADLTRIVREEDPTRPTTAACNSARPNSPFPAAIDAVGLNYQGSRPPTPQYPAFHESFPNQFLFGSETASTISSRGEYTFPVAAQPGAVSSAFGGRGRGAGGNTNIAPVAPPAAPPGQDVTNHQMSSYDLYYPNWATSPDTEFAAQDRYAFVGGEFVWTGFDYLGEPTPWGRGNDPSRSSYFGIIDLAGFKKDRFYIFQAKWRPDFPMAHILPHWNWPDRIGEVTPVHVYTSGDEAELFLNGKSLGRKKKAQFEYRLRWDDVKYAAGTLKVVAYKNGKRWATEVMKTTGPAVKLALEADRNKIRADGQDLSFVTVTVADKGGLLVPRSKNRVRFEIEGPGEIVATDNGDATSFESFQSKERNAYNGLALVIVRAKAGMPGPITLKAQSDGLKGAQIAIRSAPAN